MNIVDGSPISITFLDELAEKHLVGAISITKLSHMLDEHEQACMYKYFQGQKMQSKVVVYLVPVRQHMPPRSVQHTSWANRQPRSSKHHAHFEHWIILLFTQTKQVVTAGGRQFTSNKRLLWPVKRESELLSGVGNVDLRAVLSDYGQLAKTGRLNV